MSMEQAQEQALQEALVNSYQANLELFRQVDPELYKRLVFLAEAIATGEYKERYFLEFVRDSGDFDIYDEHEEKYLYNKEPKKWNNKISSNTNLDTSGSFNLLNSDLYNKNITDLTEEEFSLYPLCENKAVIDIQPFKDVLNETDFGKTKKIKRFEKFIFIGTLAGRHILETARKIDCRTFFVCESNLEIFRLSLFTFDYSILFVNGRQAYFSIMDSDENFIEKFTKFFGFDVTRNILYKYQTTDYNVDHFYDLILNAIYKFDPYGYNYRVILENILKRTSKNYSKYNLLTLQNDSTTEIFFDKPVLLLGAGPSLGKNIQWVKENQNRFIIVALSATLNKLIPNDIIPDIITSYDPQGIIANHFQGGNTLEKIKDSIKLNAISSDNSVLKLFENDKNLFAFETFKSMFDNATAISGASVGEASLMILLLLKTKEIFMLGLDLALDQKTGRTHIDTHGSHDTYTDMETISKEKKSVEKGTFSLREDYIQTKGNFFDKVVTTRFFYTSILDMNSITKGYKPLTTTIYNLSEEGAFFERTTPFKIENVDLDRYSTIDKKELLKDLEEEFLKFSDKKLKEKSSIQKELIVIDDILVKLDSLNKKNIIRADDFEIEVASLFNYMYKNSNLFIFDLCSRYMFIINRYISYCFNLKELKHEKSKIKKVKYIWTKQLSNILEDYKKYLGKIIE